MQGQQTVAASSAGGSAANSTAGNASATGVSTSGATSMGNEKPLTPTNRSNNTPPPPASVVSTIAATNVNGPGENDAMNSLDEQTATSGDLINKDRS